MSEAVDNIEIWLFKVDRVRTDAKIPDAIYNSVIDFISESIKFSTKHIF